MRLLVRSFAAARGRHADLIRRATSCGTQVGTPKPHALCPRHPLRLSGFCTAGAREKLAAEVSDAVAKRARWGRRIVGGTLGLVAVASAIDEGFRRCVEFWVVILPIYLHYMYIHHIAWPEGSDAKARNAEFDRLHDRYSPIIEKATLYMRGFYLKAAQMMSMREDFMPQQYLTWVKKLQHEAPVALSAEDARRCVADELGLSGDVSDVFSEWDDTPIGSASIGQVYKARLRSTGELVAVKVQAPGIERLFRADITTLKFFTALALPWAVAHMNEIEKMFRTEFDYDLERENLELIRGNVMPRWSHSLKIPKPIPHLCTKKVLCMELLVGEKLVDGVQRRMRLIATSEGRDPDAYEQEHLENLRNRRVVARSARSMHWRLTVWRWWRWLRGDTASTAPVDLAELMETLMAVHGEQVFSDGVFNGDPHPGNILLLEDSRTLGLIDFGQVKVLPLEFRLKLAKLVLALNRRDVKETARLERALGLRTKYSRDDVRYRICSFWLDRDTEDVFGSMNLHDFVMWGEREDPVLEYPEDLYMVCRCSVMIRSLALAFGVKLSTVQYWRPFAEALLKKHGETY
eukprot:gnl/TRDRNA2_/TRDRNA2_85086_c0_seq2.p1 gnl/TRDRNA2_/TRDRNA2_85086_c0~~gnl/TRDRNA2_/TRDRNA2_85086_c0_seq2.p1  ORF type:complete len:588 (+),score=104.38 gnl/TRDRNA2_/TRDRNA2_85086_c0_seq2:39-1766(+)